MTDFSETSIHRHPDGSIDTDFYVRRGLRLRRAARAEALRGILGLFRGRRAAPGRPSPDASAGGGITR